MKFIEVDSSNIQGIAYEEGDLFVRFKNNAVYRYKDVPLSVYQGLLDADSKGKYFAQNIKNSYVANREE